MVDYVGIASTLKQAMNDYTARDQENYGDPDIGKAAYPKFQEKLSICRDLLHSYDYSAFFDGDDLTWANAINGGVDFLLSKNPAEHDLPEKERTQYIFTTFTIFFQSVASFPGTIIASSLSQGRIGGGEAVPFLSFLRSNFFISYYNV